MKYLNHFVTLVYTLNLVLTILLLSIFPFKQIEAII